MRKLKKFKTEFDTFKVLAIETSFFFIDFYGRENFNAKTYFENILLNYTNLETIIKGKIIILLQVSKS